MKKESRVYSVFLFITDNTWSNILFKEHLWLNNTYQKIKNIDIPLRAKSLVIKDFLFHSSQKPFQFWNRKYNFSLFWRHI